MSKRYERVASISELPAGTMRGVNVEGHAILLCNVDGRCFAVKDECTHERFPLSAGHLSGGRLTCALHGACFDVATGEVMGPPAFEDLETYEVRLDGEDVMVALD